MRGFPKHLNTKQDYQNMLKSIQEETKEALRAVYDGRFTWQPVKKLKDNENPKQTDTKQIREIPAMEEGQIERWLYEYKEDANAWFFKLGFSVEEAETILNQEAADHAVS